MTGTAAAFGAEPLPVPVEKQEQISRRMIALQQVQIAALQAVAEARDKLAKESAAEAEFTAFMDKVKKELHAESCEITTEKTWSCPAPAKK